MEEDIEAVTSGALLHFRVKNSAEILPDYLTFVLDSDIYPDDRYRRQRFIRGSF